MAASATMPVRLDEQALIEEIIAGIELPDGVTFDRIVLTSDWSGDPAWYVHFSIAKRSRYTQKYIRSLSAVRHELHERMRPFQLEKWAYVHFHGQD